MFLHDGVLSKRAAVNSFALHAFAALIVSPIAVFVVLLTAVLVFDNSPRFNSVINSWGVANPFLWAPGLLLGFVLNRIALRRTACWVWVVGLVWMAFGLLASLLSYHARWLGICSPFDSIMSGFFSMNQGYCGDSSNVMAFTLPTFSSIAYSAGAWAA